MKFKFITNPNDNFHASKYEFVLFSVPTSVVLKVFTCVNSLQRGVNQLVRKTLFIDNENAQSVFSKYLD